MFLCLKKNLIVFLIFFTFTSCKELVLLSNIYNDPIGSIDSGLSSIPTLEVYTSKMNIKIGEEKEVPFIIRQQQTQGRIILLSQDPSIVEIISSTAGVIKGIKKGNTKIRINYLSLYKDIEINVE